MKSWKKREEGVFTPAAVNKEKRRKNRRPADGNFPNKLAQKTPGGGEQQKYFCAFCLLEKTAPGYLSSERGGGKQGGEKRELFVAKSGGQIRREVIQNSVASPPPSSCVTDSARIQERERVEGGKKDFKIDSLFQFFSIPFYLPLPPLFVEYKILTFSNSESCTLVSSSSPCAGDKTPQKITLSERRRSDFFSLFFALN